MPAKHLPLATITANLAAADLSPQDNGTVEMIVCRPENNHRQILERAEFDTVEGLVGDNWYARGSRHTDDGKAEPAAQIAIMNSRLLSALSPDRTCWPLAGDQLFLDLDLSEENLPPGQRLQLGNVILEITDKPHNGCKKFTERFGLDAMKFVDAEKRRRGIYAIVIEAGVVETGDTVSKLEVN